MYVHYRPVVMDGITYRVRIKADPPLEESFEILEGENSLTLLSGEESPDILGTCYDHTLSVEPDPQYHGDYDSFFQAISAPVACHTITMPQGQGTITYRARVTAGSHQSRGVMRGVRRWSGLQVQFRALAPQREP